MAGRADGEPAALVTLITLTALVMLVSLGVFLAASRIASLLSATGNIVLTRLLGIILAALAVQFVIAGTTAVMSPHLRCARALHQIVLCQAGPS